MKYQIKIYYQTGDSYSNNDETIYLELTWNNLDVAKENLQRIKEHYEMYNDVEKMGRFSQKRTKEQWFELNKDKEWFVYEPKLYCVSRDFAIDESNKKKYEGDWEYRPDWYFAFHTLRLKTDDGTPMRMGAFWCGYFEQLYEASIEIGVDSPDSDGMSVRF